MSYQIHHGDCLDVLRAMPDASVDAVVTDPPYGLAFMGKRWDYDVPSVEVWAECLRVLKPGGHLLAFAGTRTQHRMAVRIEDAGFEIRDMIAWVYGSGFPKSLDVSKAIDKAAGAEREVVGSKVTGRALGGSNWRDGDAGGQETVPITAPATDAARAWQGWGTALKPALEPITVARKPLAGTVAQNVLAHGTGALNIDGCRVAPTGESRERVGEASQERRYTEAGGTDFAAKPGVRGGDPDGRWPANLIHDGSDEVTGLFPQAGGGFGKRGAGPTDGRTSYALAGQGQTVGYGDTGSAARFFYCSKASKADRGEGLEAFAETFVAGSNQAKAELKRGNTDFAGDAENATGWHKVKAVRNHHPTVKPTDLMRYLCRLVTPPGGLVLDPFAGSGSTGKAAVMEGFRFVGIEREAEYVEIARARIAAVAPSLFAAE